MRTIKTTTGVEIPLDGDLLAVIETLFQEVTARHELERTFEDMMREIQHLVDQMTTDELRTYFIESLFLNTVTYENERLGAYMRKLADEPEADVAAPVARCHQLPGHPLHLLLALEHARHAVRRPHRLRLRRPVRQARPGRRAHGVHRRHLDRARRRRAARGPQRAADRRSAATAR